MTLTYKLDLGGEDKPAYQTSEVVTFKSDYPETPMDTHSRSVALSGPLMRSMKM